MSINIVLGVTKKSLVTQPMLQHQPNRTELRSMDSYIQILCRFQKYKQKVHPPSPLSTQESPFTLSPLKGSGLDYIALLY